MILRPQNWLSSPIRSWEVKHWNLKYNVRPSKSLTYARVLRRMCVCLLMCMYVSVSVSWCVCVLVCLCVDMYVTMCIGVYVLLCDRLDI